MSCRDREAGQALVEFALIAPLLVLMLGGVVYCGGLIIVQERLAMTARYAARQAAITGTRQALEKKGQNAAVEGAVFKRAAEEAAPGWSGMTVAAPPDWPKNTTRVNDYTRVYARTGSIKVGKSSYKVGVGCLLYGVQVRKNLAGDLSPLSQIVRAFGGRLTALTNLGANSFMPGDLPPSGGGSRLGSSKGAGSVLGLNPWIAEIVNDPKP